MGKLTDVQIRNWIKAGDPVAKADGDGLTFTLSAKGTAAWVLRYRFGGKARELTIGRYPDISLSKARELAAEARVQIQQGRDVAREKQKATIERAAAKTLRELAADYMSKAFPHLAANTIKQRRHHIEGVILPKLGSLPAREVMTADVVALVEAVGKKSVNVAELVFTAVSEIFKHGLARHVVTANPCAGISVSAICGKPEPKRQRLKLTEDELRVILPALPGIGAENALAVKIQLATCVRLGELAKAEWAHVDFDRAEWFVPDQNSKTGRGFTIPLPPPVVGWFRELEPFACGSRFVLPARQVRRTRNHGGEVHFEQRAMNAMLHKLCEKLGDKVRRFTPHDLRSTARSHLAALGVNILVAERCLNHSLGGLIAIYDQHDYMTERRAALELWTDFILACEAGRAWLPQGDNVIPLRKAGAA
ncbi:tyrosine-type recombinase/integrase [Brachymonas denitrificans]|uniref:tyrosine-type recombinase/integrase n=1 Tax=Brachymonas denitrificans TaxID=28220 RepID=UPI00321FBF2B